MTCCRSRWLLERRLGSTRCSSRYHRLWSERNADLSIKRNPTEEKTSMRRLETLMIPLMRGIRERVNDSIRARTSNSDWITHTTRGKQGKIIVSLEFCVRCSYRVICIRRECLVSLSLSPSLISLVTRGIERGNYESYGRSSPRIQSNWKSIRWMIRRDAFFTSKLYLFLD